MDIKPFGTRNYLRLVAMFIDVGAEVIYRVFMYYVLLTGTDLEAFLYSRPALMQLEEWKRRNVLSVRQLRVDQFDISLWCNLFAEDIKPYEKCWKSKPASTDFTLGADLIRLRRYRNKVVGLMSDARLSDQLFSTYWNDLETIFVRICKKIDPVNEQSIQRKIQTYKSMDFDQQMEKRYREEMQSIREDCEDIVKLQKKAETLILELKELTKYFVNRSRRYSCYIRLLFEGGQVVLAALLKKACWEEGKDIHLLVDEISKADLEELQQRNDFKELKVKNPEEWDILYLVNAILYLCKDTIDTRQKKCLHFLLDERQNYAKLASELLDDKSFSKHHNNLVLSLIILSHGLCVEVVRKCAVSIYTCSDGVRNGGDDYDAEKYLERLRLHGFKIRNLSDIYTDRLNELKEALKEMENEGIGFSTEQVFQLKVITTGEDEEKKRLAKGTLGSVWQSALMESGNSDDFHALRHEVDNMLKEIRKRCRYKFRRSVSFAIDVVCDTVEELHHVLDFVQSKSTDTRLKTIAGELTKQVGYTIDVRLEIDDLQLFSDVFPDKREPFLQRSHSASLPLDTRVTCPQRSHSASFPLETKQASLVTDNGTLMTKTFSQMSVTDNRTNIDANFCYRQTQFHIEELAHLQGDFLKEPNEKALKELRVLVENICSHFRAIYKNANYIWLAYRENKVRQCGIQLFLMIEIRDDCILPKDDFPDKTFEVCVYKIHADEIIGYEAKSPNQRDIVDELSYQDLIKMRTSINKHADRLLASHSHLTIIQPSGVRLRHSTHITEKCISLYVRKKGYIPLGETPFESRIEEYLTDVREGIAYQAMQNEGAATLKMGCKIARLENPREEVTRYGTLGGFIDHPEYGICGLTSAHVLLRNNEMNVLMDTGEISWLQIPSKIEVYIFDEDNREAKIGTFVKAVYDQGHIGSYGFEVAIFQIESSFNVSGEFRDTGGDNEQHFFNKGKIFSPINCSQDLSFRKYGAFTGKTTGTFTQRLPACTIRMQATPSRPVSDSITLMNQLAMRGEEGRPFSCIGDSGSLVMAPGESGETLCVGIVEGISDEDNTITFVSPIGPVLEKLAVSSFKCYQQDELLATVRTLSRTTDEILHVVNRLNVPNRPFCDII